MSAQHSIDRIDGTITRADGGVIHFALDSDGYAQWGVDRELLRATVGALIGMEESLKEADWFRPRYADRMDEED